MRVRGQLDDGQAGVLTDDDAGLDGLAPHVERVEVGDVDEGRAVVHGVLHAVPSCHVVATPGSASVTVPGAGPSMLSACTVHAPRTDPPTRLRLRGGAIRQRLIAAAWPGLAELALEPTRAWRAPIVTRRSRPTALSALPATRPR